MRTLEWIVKDNARICAEHNIRSEHPIDNVTPDEVEYIRKTYHGCVANFSCDLRPTADMSGWEFVQDKDIPALVLDVDHFNACQLCRQALLIHRMELAQELFQ